MEFSNTTEILHANAEEVRQIIVRLQNAGTLSAIELDLILEKLRNMYDLVLNLKTVVPEIKKEKDESVKESPEIISRTNEPLPEPEPQEDTGAFPQEPEPAAKAEIEFTEEKTSGAHEPREKAFVSDRFKTSQPTINEEIAGKLSPGAISRKLSQKPVTNITGALGLNEKFELVKELFGGDKEKFEDTMQVLNRADSFVDALNYLNANFEWDMENVYVQRLLELIRRKLIVRRNEE